ncbi:oxidoreductase [Streptomyces sp. CNQ-509]|uniref:FAD/NAD(P)-binding protein n=1 Tax=unclassified Streptomyces TaxID=2593676 RepID=UPI00062DD52F|nr:FAD/NAD(P)-binding protein [Streptomyces sp. CNQ-509]AKH85629.1 oxidoreductase [Streptomyces sp. CNQ-509]
MTAAPVPYRVVRRTEENADTATLVIEPTGEKLPLFRPGQFAMVCVPGVGETPVPVSGILEHRSRLTHTVRAEGPVPATLHAARPGRILGVRGPFGTGWTPEAADGGDVLVVAEGSGLAPLRPLVRSLLARTDRYDRISLLVGARSPADLLYRHELRCLNEASATHVAVTVDLPPDGWRGGVGTVTRQLDRAPFDPPTTTAFVCGPEAMIRATARELLRRGVPAQRIRVSLERNMHCAAGHCDHCRLGPVLLCREGPVVGYDRVADLLAVNELCDVRAQTGPFLPAPPTSST